MEKEPATSSSEARPSWLTGKTAFLLLLILVAIAVIIVLAWVGPMAGNDQTNVTLGI
jgi:hypothetical protein